MAARRTVKVMCSIPNGVELRTFGPGYDDGTGTGNQIAPRVVDSIVLRGPPALSAGVNSPEGYPVETEVDAEAWDRFMEQNKKVPHPLLADASVYVKPEKQEPK